MVSCEFLRGYKAALRHLLDAAECDGGSGKRKNTPRMLKMKIVTKKTAEWLKLCHEHAYELAEGEVLELWQTPEGKLFFKETR